MKKLLSTMVVLGAVLVFVASSYAVSTIADNPWPNLDSPSDDTWYAHTFNISGSYDPNSQMITPATLIYLFNNNDGQADDLSELSYVTIDGVNKVIRGIDNPNDWLYDVNMPHFLGLNGEDYEVSYKLLPLRYDFIYDKAEHNDGKKKYVHTSIPSIVWFFGLGLIGFLMLRRRPMNSVK